MIIKIDRSILFLFLGVKVKRLKIKFDKILNNSNHESYIDIEIINDNFLFKFNFYFTIKKATTIFWTQVFNEIA